MTSKSTLSNGIIDLKLTAKAEAVLRSLHVKHIHQLILQWLSASITRPQIRWTDRSTDICYQPEDEIPEDALQRMANELKEQIKDISFVKKLLLRTISEDYWPNGLNLLQVAQIQCKSLMEFARDTHVWGYSTLYLGKDEFIPSIDPQSFVKGLSAALHPMILGHLYTTTHPQLSLIMVRIQIFEPKLAGPDSAFVPIKPIYIAFPLSSPHILHTFGDDVYLTAVFHSLQSILSRPGLPVRLQKSNSLPSKNLATFATLKGVSRHSAALGPWSIYADGLVDESPLNMLKSTKRKTIQPTNDSTEKKIRLANTKFTGRPDGALTKKQLEKGNKYKSKIPMNMAEFRICEPFDSILNEPEFTIRLEGSDVFAGIYHHVLSTDHKIEELPGWLTGEENATSGVVRNGILEAD